MAILIRTAVGFSAGNVTGKDTADAMPRPVASSEARPTDSLKHLGDRVLWESTGGHPNEQSKFPNQGAEGI